MPKKKGSPKGKSKGYKGSKKGKPSENEPETDPTENATNQGDLPCPFCPKTYPSSELGSWRSHISGHFSKGRPENAPASENLDDSFDEIGELKARRNRLQIEKQIQALEGELSKSGGDMELERRLRGVEDLLRKRDEQLAFQSFEHRFNDQLSTLRGEIRRLRNDGHPQMPVHQDNSREFQDLMQTIHNLRGEIQRERQNSMMQEIEHLRSEVQGSQTRSPQPFETEAAMNRDFLQYSSDVGKVVLTEMGGLRRDIRQARSDLKTEILPIAKQLGRALAGPKLRVILKESVEKDEYQPEERELTPDQLEELDRRLTAELGEGYENRLSDQELEARATQELDIMKVEDAEMAMKKYMPNNSETEIDPGEVEDDDSEE